MASYSKAAVAGDSAAVPAKLKPATKTKSVKASKAKESSGSKKPKAHRPYVEMIQEAIVALKERTGSSQYAIAKFIEEKQKEHLPTNFKKLLLVQLKKLVASGKLTKVKNSFKLSVPAKPSAAVAKKTPSEATKKKVAAKPKTIVGAVKAKKVVVKPKPKTAAKVATPVKKKAAKAVVSKAKKVPAKGVKKPKSIKSPAKKVAVKKSKK